MKIVGFHTNNGTRIGVVDGDAVVDVTAVDASVPSDLGEWLRTSNGDLRPLADIARDSKAARLRLRNEWHYWPPDLPIPKIRARLVGIS